MTKNLKQLQKGLDNKLIQNLTFYNDIAVKDLDYPTLQRLSIERRTEIESQIKHDLGIDFSKKIPLNEVQKTLDNVHKKITNVYFDGNRSSLSDMTRWRGQNDNSWIANIEIAAVQTLFTQSAFERDNSRLGNQTNELTATGQVDLDPIVMIKNYRGYIIITAWGDEANDELVVNQQLN
jgi:hypothetical protein